MFGEWNIIIISIILGIAGLVQGYSGFAYGIVAMALMAFLPYQMSMMATVVTLTAAAVLLLLLFLSHNQGRIQWRESAVLLLGGFFGTPLGYGFIAWFGDRPIFRLALAGYLVWAGLNGLRQRHPGRRMRDWMAFPVGVFSGFLGGAFVTGGPPALIYLYSRSNDPRTMKSTVQMVFLAMLLNRILIILFDPSLRSGELWVFSAVVSVPTIIGLVAGHRLSLLSSPMTFRGVVYGLIAVLGLFVAAKAFLSFS